MAEPTRLAIVSRRFQGEEATAEVVRFLRSVADGIESGEEKPAHKAVLVMYQDVAEKFAVRSRFCNVTVIERTGMLQIAQHDNLNAD